MEKQSWWQRLQGYREATPNPETVGAFSFGWWRWVSESGPKRLARDAGGQLAPWVILSMRSGEKVADAEWVFVIPVLITIAVMEGVALMWYLLTAAAKQRDCLREELRVSREKLGVYEVVAAGPNAPGPTDWLAVRETLTELRTAVSHLLDRAPQTLNGNEEMAWMKEKKHLVSRTDQAMKGLRLPDSIRGLIAAPGKKTTRRMINSGTVLLVNHSPELARIEVGLGEAVQALSARFDLPDDHQPTSAS